MARREQISFYIPDEDAGRARAALMHTVAHEREGHRTMSELIRAALMVEVERLERLYNGGEPWEPIGPNEVPRGRPAGS